MKVHKGWMFLNRVPDVWWDMWGFGINLLFDGCGMYVSFHFGPIHWEPTLMYPGEWEQADRDDS